MERKYIIFETIVFVTSFIISLVLEEMQGFVMISKLDT